MSNTAKKIAKKVMKKPSPPAASTAADSTVIPRDAQIAMLRALLSGEDSIAVVWDVTLVRKDATRDMREQGLSVLSKLLSPQMLVKAVDLLNAELMSKLVDPIASCVQDELNQRTLDDIPGDALGLPAPRDGDGSREQLSAIVDADAVAMSKQAQNDGDELEDD